MGVFILGLLGGAFLGSRLARNVDAFRGARAAVGKAAVALTQAQAKASGTRTALTRFVVVLAIAVIAFTYGWIKQNA
jgi:hypothetical protein